MRFSSKNCWAAAICLRFGVAVFVQELLGGSYLPEVRRPVMFLQGGGRWLHPGTGEPGQFFPDAFDDGFRYFLYERFSSSAKGFK